MDENRRPGEVWSEQNQNSRREIPYRINPRTGVEETLVDGRYWEDRSYIIRDKYGNVEMDLAE